VNIGTSGVASVVSADGLGAATLAGFGAAAACDGQILVLEDMLGLSPRPAKFVREFATLGAQIAGAAEAYACAVRERSFPAVEHTYSMKKAK